MWSLVRGEPETVVRFFRPLLLSGMIVGFIVTRFDLPGIISCVHVATLGAAGGSLVRWRTERGLWMLAGLFLVVFSAGYLLMFVGQFFDILRNAAQPPLSLTIDLAVGTMFLSANIRFLYRVARSNWLLSRQPIDA